MENIHWLIQTNLLNDVQVNSVWYAALESGASVHSAIVVPFQDELGNESELHALKDGIVIPYGSCKLNRLAQLNNWKGNCIDMNTFRVDVWNQKRDDMLNSNAHFLTVEQTSDFFKDADIHSEDDLWFIRPLHDLKEFSGTVVKVKDIKNWMSSVESGNFSFTPKTEIIISEPKHIYSESRVFIVDGIVVDISMYRLNNKLTSKHVTDPDIYRTVQDIADKWLPHECCVMDIADTDDGIKVIEFNSINSSGFYEHDIKKIVFAMTNWAWSKYA